jgi:hypothetical protein
LCGEGFDDNNQAAARSVLNQRRSLRFALASRGHTDGAARRRTASAAARAWFLITPSSRLDHRGIIDLLRRVAVAISRWAAILLSY